MKISKITESIKSFKRFFQNKQIGGSIINLNNSLNENILAIKSNHGGYKLFEKVWVKKGQYSDYFILKSKNNMPEIKTKNFKFKEL